VDTQKCDARRVRTPPVRAEVSASIKLFLVDPIQTAVEKLRTTVTRECALAPLHAEIFDVQVVLAHEADHASIRAEALANFFLRIARETNRTIAAKLVIEEIVGPVDQNPSLGGIEIVVTAVRELSCILRAHARQSRKRSLHFGGIEKRHSFARGGVHLLQSRHVAPRSLVG